MNPVFSWFEVIILIGITQGLFISILIWSGKNQPVSKRILSLVLTVFSLLCLRIMILTTGLWQAPVLRYFPLPFELAIAPLFWLYIVSLVDPRFSFKRSMLLHFIPFGISLVYSVIVYCMVLPKESNIEKDAVANQLLFNDVKRGEDYLCILSSIVYWSLGLRLIIRYRRWLSANISNTDFPTYAWLKNIALLMGFVIVLLSTDIVLDAVFNFGFYRFTHWKFFFVYCAALIYYLGFRGSQLQGKAAFIKTDQVDTSISTIDPVDAGTGVFNAEAVDAPPFSEKQQRLTSEKAAEMEKAIRDAMETDLLYLDPNLNLEKLAKFVRAAPAAVSYVINLRFKKTFRSLVNEYRVARVKARLSDRRSGQFSILGIAYDCGFNSEASFYRIFKLVAGVSPTEYIRSIDQSRAD